MKVADRVAPLYARGSGRRDYLGRRQLEDRHARDMHRRLGRLHVEEECIEQGKTFHDELPAVFGPRHRDDVFSLGNSARRSQEKRTTQEKMAAKGTIRKRAPGMLAAVSSPPAIGIRGSSEPCSTNVGALTRRSVRTRLGAV